MKKGTISNFTVKRISSSPYFSSSFQTLEEATISNLTGAKMLPPNSHQHASVLITNTHTELSKISDEQLAACELIIHPNSGYDNFASEFISSANFPIIIGNPIRAEAVTNFILSALFSHYSDIPNEATWNNLRKWPRKLLSELNVLILGHGHIGSLLKMSLSPLVAKVRTFDPYAGFPDMDLEKIDVLIPACSLNKKNFHLINKDLLLQLNEDFLFINAARGGLVNTTDLLTVLAARPRACAVLDVFEKEPADFEKLLENTPNIKLSSHIAGVYKNIDIVTANFEAQIILDFLTLEKDSFEHIYQSVNLKNRLIGQDFLI